VGGTFYDDIEKVLQKVDAKKIGFEDASITVAEYERVKNKFSDYEFVSASGDIALERIIKRPEEIEKIAQAEIVTQKALAKTLPLLKYGVTEKDISNEITYQMLSLGAESLAFENIVAFGANTANPHHHPTMKKLEKNDMVTFDIGAKVNGYCGDMTRTFCMGTPNETLAKIHRIVFEAQAYALENIKAGMSGREAHLLASEYILANGYGKEFSHSLGHGIGVEVHEAPTLSPRSENVLQENMVVSVEPGIYLDGIGGVRIEDLVVIKDGGIVNLTNFDKNINL
jgi:Xaa-Pro aminopeptidase